MVCPISSNFPRICLL